MTLVDCTGRAIIAESKGYIPAELPEILTRLGSGYYKAIGRIENLKKYCKSIQQQWIKGLPRASSPIKT